MTIEERPTCLLRWMVVLDGGWMVVLDLSTSWKGDVV